MLSPGVELELLVGLRDELGERARRNRIAAPAFFLSRPLDDVSPIATRAFALPALIPAYPAAASFAYAAGLTI